MQQKGEEKSFSPTFFFVAWSSQLPCSAIDHSVGSEKGDKKNFHQLLNRGCKIRQRFREKNEPFDKVQIFLFERKKSLKKTQWLDSIWCPWLPRNLIHTKAKEGNNGCERLCSLAWHNNDYCKHKHQKPTAQT